MPTLTGTKPSETYPFLLQADGGISSSLQAIEDGLGNASALELSTTEAKVVGDLTVTGKVLITDSVQSTPSGGNARGAGATDLQTVRSDTGQVAHGANSFTVGTRSASYGVGSFASGTASVATGANATAMGTESIAAGTNNIAIGSVALAAKAFSCTISGTTVTVAGQGGSLATLTNSLAALTFRGLNASVGGFTTTVRRLVSATNTSGNLVMTIDSALGSATSGTVYLAASGAVAIGSSSIASGSTATAIGGGQASGSNSFACGANAFATGSGAVAFASNTVSGSYGLSCGSSNSVTGSYSFASGFLNTVAASYAHAEGLQNTIDGSTQHGEGFNNTIDVASLYCHIEGSSNTIQAGNASHVKGTNNGLVSARYSQLSGAANRIEHSAGSGTEIYCGTAIGINSLVSAHGAFAGGFSDRVFAVDSVEGYTHPGMSDYAIQAGGLGAFAHGYAGYTSDVYIDNKPTISATGNGAVALGAITSPGGSGSYVAIGATAAGSFAAGCADGSGTIQATGIGSVAMGFSSNQLLASGIGSVAMGYNCVASGTGSVALSDSSTASSSYDIAIGSGNTASGGYSVAMGASNSATGSYGAAIGYSNTASNTHSTAIGTLNTATGLNSVAVGSNSTATADYSAAIGPYATAPTGSCNVAVGYYATASAHYAISLGYFGNNVRNADIGLPSANTGFTRASLSGAVFYSTTTNATPTALTYAIGGGSTIPLVNGMATLFEIPVIGARTAGTAEVASFMISGCVHKTSGGAAAFVGTPTVAVLGRSNAGLDASVSLSGNNLVITVTGLASQTWRWAASPRFTEIVI